MEEKEKTKGGRHADTGGVSLAKKVISKGSRTRAEKGRSGAGG